jgi:hypothetical protein
MFSMLIGVSSHRGSSDKRAKDDMMSWPVMLSIGFKNGVKRIDGGRVVEIGMGLAKWVFCFVWMFPVS